MANKAAVADHSRTIADLSAAAFAGRAAFLLECARACEFEDLPVLQRKRPTLYTYFIGAEHGPIKIGSARDVHQRLTVLQTGHPEELYIYAVADGGYTTEEALHREFADCRLRGEWFRREAPILRRILHLQEHERKMVEAA